MESIKNGKITVEGMQQILEKEYDIHNYAELEKAIEENPGIDVGIFVSPYEK